MGKVLIYVVLLGIWVYALVDLSRTPPDMVRILPKWLWVVILFVLGVVGVPLWFLLGRPRESLPPPGGGGNGGGGLGVGPRPPRPLAPDDDPDFLKRLDEQSWAARMERLRRERESGRRRDAGEEPGAGTGGDAGGAPSSWAR